MIRIYGIKQCDTMKKAFAWLDDHAIAYEFHDYKKSGVPRNALRAWIDALGADALCNTRGTTWRKIPPERTGNTDPTAVLALLIEFPSAIKRPVIETPRGLVLGFDAARFAEMLL